MVKKIIKIEDLCFLYSDQIIFDHLNLEIKESSFYTISGSSGCGKTTLLKILLGLLEYNGKITIDGIDLNFKNVRDIRKKIGIVFENPDTSFLADTPLEELENILENFDMVESSQIKIEEISKMLKIEDILECRMHSLSGGQKQMVALACALITNPKILILDEALSMLDGVQKENVLKLLKKINREQKITILNITDDLEDSVYGQDIILIDDGKVILNESIKTAFGKEKIFKKCNLELPFMASLSLKLKYYDLVDKIILDMNKMVNMLWK